MQEDARQQERHDDIPSLTLRFDGSATDLGGRLMLSLSVGFLLQVCWELGEALRFDPRSPFLHIFSVILMSIHLAADTKGR